MILNNRTIEEFILKNDLAGTIENSINVQKFLNVCFSSGKTFSCADKRSVDSMIRNIDIIAINGECPLICIYTICYSYHLKANSIGRSFLISLNEEYREGKKNNNPAVLMAELIKCDIGVLENNAALRLENTELKQQIDALKLKMIQMLKCSEEIIAKYNTERFKYEHRYCYFYAIKIEDKTNELEILINIINEISAIFTDNPETLIKINEYYQNVHRSTYKTNYIPLTLCCNTNDIILKKFHDLGIYIEIECNKNISYENIDTICPQYLDGDSYGKTGSIIRISERCFLYTGNMDNFTNLVKNKLPINQIHNDWVKDN